MISPSDSATAIRLDSVRKQFGQTTALNDVSLHAARGSFVVLLGPSGCGKSTLLRVLAGLEDATSGRIELAGRDVARLPPAARGISMVFQSYALFPHLSVAENIVFGLRARRVPAAERAARLAQAAELVGLGKLLERRPAQLSGGQQQRVALARALAPSPKLLLLDEPFSSLDAETRGRLVGEVRGILRDAGQTALMVTHDPEEAEAMADWIGVMGEGRLVEWRRS